MTDHTHTLEQWHETLTNALLYGAHDAIPAILVRMARDGWEDEVVEARRILAADTAPLSLGALTGHDDEAARRLRILRDAYRRGGLPVLRAVCSDVLNMYERDALASLLVEAVLTLQEHGPGARRAAEQAAFDLVEQANENEAIRKGGR